VCRVEILHWAGAAHLDPLARINAKNITSLLSVSRDRLHSHNPVRNTVKGLYSSFLSGRRCSGVIVRGMLQMVPPLFGA
jgi:hypothetical protein